MTLTRWIYFFALLAYVAWLTLRASRKRPLSSWPHEALKLTVCTLLPPIGWFTVLVWILSHDLRWEKPLGIVTSAIMTIVAAILFVGWIGIGMNRGEHPESFYLFQFAAWFAVPAALWTSWIRSIRLERKNAGN